MADMLPISCFLPPIYFAKKPLAVPAHELEEFSTSPVDDVRRALAHASANIWIAKQLGDMPPVLKLDLKNFLTSTFESHELSDRSFYFLGHGFPPETELVTGLPSGQLTLKMAGDFSPSKKLADIWLSSLSILAKEADRQVHVTPEFEAAQEFSKILYSLLGTIAQQLRYENPSNTLLTRQQRFTAAYQIQLCDAFLIIPDKAADFLSLLFFELSEAIRAGCTFNGDWGELRVSPTQELYFRLSPPDFVVDSNFVESEEVE
jgi:hypothetical protein